MPTKIDWTDESINPVIGCTKITAGCANCYAERMAKRLAAMGLPRYQGVTTSLGWTGEVRYYPQALAALDKLKPGTRVFVGSMADVFHPQLDERDRLDLLDRLTHYPHLTLQFLTKRPDIMAETMADLFTRKHRSIPANWWLGTSISAKRDAEEMLGWLLTCQTARVLYASYEPAIETIDWTRWLIKATRWNIRSLDWLICGAETGPRRRIMPIAGARQARDQAHEYGVPFFFKKDNTGAPTLDGITYHEFPA